MQMREKVGKSRNTAFFQWFVAPEGRKVGSLKRRVPSHLARWEMKMCTPLWREAHFEVKMHKTHQLRTTFGSWDAKHISKSKCTKHTMFGPLLKVEMSKKCTLLWREAHFEVKMYKTHQLRTTFRSCDVEKVHSVVARSNAKHISKSKVLKTDGYGALLDVQMCFRVAGAGDCAPYQKWAKREGLVAFPKTMAGAGNLKRICKGAFRVAGAVQKTCSSEMLGGQGDDFLRGVAFWSIRSVGLLRWFCVTGAALRMTWYQFFVAGAVL